MRVRRNTQRLCDSPILSSENKAVKTFNNVERKRKQCTKCVFQYSMQHIQIIYRGEFFYSHLKKKKKSCLKAFENEISLEQRDHKI